MSTNKQSLKNLIIPCKRSEIIKQSIEDYAEALKIAAPSIGDHGLEKKEFEESGLFEAAIERLRGQHAASMKIKKAFIAAILNFMKSKKTIKDWEFSGAHDRHDYTVILPSGKYSVFEAKGCLDGNNTNIYKRPPNAEEFVLWSLCQNSGSDPGHNAWSGIHTRLGANIIDTKEKVDGVVIWDMLCGSKFRSCPKLEKDKSRLTGVGQDLSVPPPCIYLFPATIPDPRNNPSPRTHSIEEVGLLNALFESFKCLREELYEIKFDTRMSGPNLERRTTIIRGGKVLRSSRWTKLLRASR